MGKNVVYNGGMKNEILKLFSAHKIEYVGFLPFERCRVNKPHLLRGCGFEPKSAVMFLVPYYTGEHPGRNLSLYAVSRDYHRYFAALFSSLEKELSLTFPEYRFKGFSDHSPIGETYAAALAGLGRIGDCYQLINDAYGSYTFIGELFTDAPLDACDVLDEPRLCEHCGACRKSCPSPDHCLSAITQRKGVLTDGEIAIMRKEGTVWGCDRCQSVCPHNRSPKTTPIAFFYQKQTPRLTASSVKEMTDEDFLERAYSWRGREVILRNIEALEKDEPYL